MLTCVTAIIYREFSAIFRSRIGVAGIIFAILFWSAAYYSAIARLDNNPTAYQTKPLAAIFADPIVYVFLLFIPLLAMRAWVEEKNSGNYELLLTYPFAKWQMVVGKFCSMWLYYACLWLPSLWSVMCLCYLGYIDYGQIVVFYSTVLLIAGALLALGLLCSYWCQTQLLAFLLTLATVLAFSGRVFIHSNSANDSFTWFGDIAWHLAWAQRGMVNSATVVLFGTLALVGIVGNIVAINARWWLTATRTGIPKTVAIRGYHRIVRIFCWLCLILLLQRWSYQHQQICEVNIHQMFTLGSATTATLRQAIPDGDRVKIIALLGFSEYQTHEYMERDNDRYFLLREVLEKFTVSLPTKLTYEFMHPIPEQQALPGYLEQARQYHQRLSELQSQYGIFGHRELLFVYRNRYRILQDKDLFRFSLEPWQVPRLLLLWRKIYEAGGIGEPPPIDEQNAFAALQQMVHPEMMSVYLRNDVDEIIANTIRQLVHDDTKKVYFSQGHSELAIGDYFEPSFHTAHYLGKLLQRENFLPVSWSLASGEIPKDCHTFVIAGAQTELSAQELVRVNNYLTQGGSVVILLHPETNAGLDELFAKHNLQINPALAKHTRSNGEVTDMLVIPYVHQQHEIQQYIEQKNADSQPLVFYQCRNVEPVLDTTAITPILPVPLRTFTESGQTPAHNVGAIVKNTGNLVVIGNHWFISDTLFSNEIQTPYILMGSNRLLLLAILHYLTAQPEQIKVPAQTFPTYSLKNTLPNKVTMTIASHLLLILLVGAIYHVRRKRSSLCSSFIKKCL